MTRGLALRSLCSLRLPNMTEYVMLPIRKGLNDPSPYVRANAVTGVSKLFRTCPESVKVHNKLSSSINDWLLGF